MRILIDIIPAEYRKIVYALFAAIGLVLGILTIVLNPIPASVISFTAAYNFVGVALGITAYSNTDASTYAPIEDEKLGE